MKFSELREHGVKASAHFFADTTYDDSAPMCKLDDNTWGNAAKFLFERMYYGEYSSKKDTDRVAALILEVHLIRAVNEIEESMEAIMSGRTSSGDASARAKTDRDRELDARTAKVKERV